MGWGWDDVKRTGRSVAGAAGYDWASNAGEAGKGLGQLWRDMTGGGGAAPPQLTEDPTRKQYMEAQQDRMGRAQGRYADAQRTYQGREAAPMDWSQAGQDYSRQQAVGANQDYLGDYYKAMLEGKQPSVAEQQMRAGIGQSIQAQMAAANSARGGVAQSAALRNAQGMAGDMQMQGVQQSGMLRAQEQQNAAQGYGGLLAQQRAAELQAMGLSQEQAIAQAENEMRQRALNDAMTQSYLGAETSTMGGLYGGLVEQRGQEYGKYASDSAAAAAQAQADAQNRAGLYGAAATAGSALIGMLRKK
jgi:hypothetical protein